MPPCWNWLDINDLGSLAVRRVGSSPTGGTSYKKAEAWLKRFQMRTNEYGFV